MSDWINASGEKAASSSNLAQPGQAAPSYHWGRGGMELVAGHGMKPSLHAEYTTAPTVDRATGLTFSTEAGHPVPGGIPRPHDLVEIGGMKVKVAQAVRDSLIPDPSRGPLSAPESAREAARHVTPQAQPSASPEASPSLADEFTGSILPRVSPATVASIEADLIEGFFSTKSTDYVQLEGGLSAGEMEAVRDAFAAKITAATGMDEDELQELWQSNRQGFAKAAMETLRTGSTAGFATLASTFAEAAYTPMSEAEAMNAWAHEDFADALKAAGIKADVSGPELAIEVPGRGTVLWRDAVRQGLVKVSRYA